MTTTLKQRAYNHIRGQLVAGRLTPGERLCNRSLAQEIGVSLIPVREAISQLVSEGLAEHRPRMGAFVRTPKCAQARGNANTITKPESHRWSMHNGNR